MINAFDKEHLRITERERKRDREKTKEHNESMVKGWIHVHEPDP